MGLSPENADRATFHCYNCGRPLVLSGVPGRSEVCPSCREYLRVCFNCAHWDPHLAYQCDDRRAEEVEDKTKGNFCEYFEFAKRIYTPRIKDTARENKSRESLKKLFDL